jgi:hypothetical protein
MLHELGCFAREGGGQDNRHPHGRYDDMRLLTPQIKKDWGGYQEAIAAYSKHPLWAFKLQSALMHWGRAALLALPRVRPILLDRNDWETMAKGCGSEGWLKNFYRSTAHILATAPPCLALTYEQLQEDPEQAAARIAAYIYPEAPPADISERMALAAARRVKKQ